MRALIPLLSLVTVTAADGTCDATVVQSTLESFFSKCIPNKGIKWQDDCWEVHETDSIKKTGCEWANRINGALFMAGSATLCDMSKMTAVDVNTSLVEVPADLCTLSTEKVENCTQTANITKISYPTDLSDELECGCLESHLKEIRTCKPLSDIIATPELVPTDSKYYNFSEFRSDAGCLLTCTLDELPVVETSDSSIYNLSVTIHNNNERDLFKTVISSITGGEVAPSQVFIKLWEEIEGTPDRFTVHFAIVNVPTMKLTSALDDVNKALADETSIIRREMEADPTSLVEVPSPPPPEPVIVVKKEDEVPTYMIALCIVFGVLLLVIAAAFVINYLGDDEEGEGDNDEGEEMGEGAAEKELPEDEEQ
eukprot:TRINITY_DN1367_c12_g1_i1.p1 TRINITY_DN1367_c12_g1~~TRINITY_DN1367_c12_g1_i1.p1  ORF type:complete len:368 (+),score=87.03 TRINITY_DN1367_c12_g1_i1:71-1174(+)